MNNKKIYYGVLIVLLLIILVSTTYAFFAPQAGGTTSTNATVTSNTTDQLTFSINRDISFTVTQADFQENGQNQSGDATATATLTPNNKTGAATMNYYLYLDIESNPTVYSEANTNHDPELMLQVFDGSNQLVTLTGLGTQKTIKGVTGYDITGVTGLKTLLDNHAISASNSTATIENWKVVITLINLDVNQNDNTGKTISAEIIIQRDELSLGFTGTIYRNNDNLTINGVNYLNGGAVGGDTYSGVGTYGIDTTTLRLDHGYYLKHEVINDMIQNTEVCLYYNNEEFCFGPNYWVETGNGDEEHSSQENGDATMYKLAMDMESVLGEGGYCNNGTWQAWCRYGNFDCIVDSNGEVSIMGSGRLCRVNSDGSSECFDK